MPCVLSDCIFIWLNSGKVVYIIWGAFDAKAIKRQHKTFHNAKQLFDSAIFRFTVGWFADPALGFFLINKAAYILLFHIYYIVKKDIMILEIKQLTSD